MAEYKLPASVEIGPYTYQLQRTKEADSNNEWGFTSHVRRIIGFGVLCDEQEMPSTLIHELVHAIINAYGVKLEEQEIIALANGLTQALMSLKLLPKIIYLKEKE